MILVRGIGANWLVCMACFLAFSAREYFSKVVAIWWPTFAFVCLGLDHVIANMFFVPMGIFLGNPDITVGYYIWKSLLPALIGNIIGGGFFVGVAYWYMVCQDINSSEVPHTNAYCQYLLGEGPIPVDGEVFGPDKETYEGSDPEENSPAARSSSEQKKDPEHMV